MAINDTTNTSKSNGYKHYKFKPSFHALRCMCLPFVMKIAMQKYAGRSTEFDRGNMYLGRLELRELTGTPIRSRQILWLAKQGWPHVVDVHGRVLVARAYHDKQMGITEPKTSRFTPTRAPAPLNLGAV